jgi:prevent-host-death family protein
LSTEPGKYDLFTIYPHLNNNGENRRTHSVWSILFVLINEEKIRKNAKFLDKRGYNVHNGIMLMVGVRDLKNQLSQYLQYVKNGEKVIITEHNKIIAEISVPVQDKKDNVSLIEKELEKLSREGEIILAKRNKSYVKLPEIKEKIDWEKIYNETRADRL